jgi:hypothetical protein
MSSYRDKEWCRMSSVVETAAQQKIAGIHPLKGPDSLATSNDPLRSFDDKVQRRGTNLIGNVAEESDLSALLAKETVPRPRWQCSWHRQHFSKHSQIVSPCPHLTSVVLGIH